MRIIVALAIMSGIFIVFKLNQARRLVDDRRPISIERLSKEMKAHLERLGH